MDTRILYTDLLKNIIFWKLEKYTDPIFYNFLDAISLNGRRLTTYLESINIRYMDDAPLLKRNNVHSKNSAWPNKKVLHGPTDTRTLYTDL